MRGKTDATTGESSGNITSEGSQTFRMPTTTELSDAGLLSERQAEAFALRAIEGRDRHEAAELMGLTASTVDDHYRAAASKVEAANETLGLIEGSAPDEIETVVDDDVEQEVDA